MGKKPITLEAFLSKGKKVHIIGELNVDKQGKLVVVANEQALRENVLYQRNQNKNSSEETQTNSQEEEYKPFTDIADDGSLLLFIPMTMISHFKYRKELERMLLPSSFLFILHIFFCQFSQRTSLDLF